MGNKQSQTTRGPILSKSQIANIELEDVFTGDKFLAKSLWEVESEDVLLIYLIRRPGCQLCREQAELLSDMIEYNPSMKNVKLVGVVHEYKYLEDITTLKEKYFRGNPVYLDREKNFYNAQGMRRLGLHAILWASVMKAIRRASSKGIKGNTRGDGTLLGGVLVVDVDKVWFEHREDFFGDLVIADELILSISLAQKSRESRGSISIPSSTDRSSHISV